MTIEDIKTYDELDDYCKDVGYENLTDEDIDALCAKVREIRDANIEDIKARNTVPGAIASLETLAKCEAASEINFLNNCTPERKRRNMEKLWNARNKNTRGIRPDDEYLNDKEKSMERTLY